MVRDYKKLKKNNGFDHLILLRFLFLNVYDINYLLYTYTSTNNKENKIKYFSHSYLNMGKGGIT